jgi:hypothetical protein
MDVLVTNAQMKGAGKILISLITHLPKKQCDERGSHIENIATWEAQIWKTEVQIQPKERVPGRLAALKVESLLQDQPELKHKTLSQKLKKTRKRIKTILLIGTTWMKLEDIMLTERSYTQNKITEFH